MQPASETHSQRLQEKVYQGEPLSGSCWPSRFSHPFFCAGTLLQ